MKIKSLFSSEVDNPVGNPVHGSLYKKRRGIIRESEQRDTSLLQRETLDIQNGDKYVCQKMYLIPMTHKPLKTL